MWLIKAMRLQRLHDRIHPRLVSSRVPKARSLKHRKKDLSWVTSFRTETWQLDSTTDHIIQTMFNQHEQLNISGLDAQQLGEEQSAASRNQNIDDIPQQETQWTEPRLVVAEAIIIGGASFSGLYDIRTKSFQCFRRLSAVSPCSSTDCEVGQGCVGETLERGTRHGSGSHLQIQNGCGFAHSGT